jgi:hypothetical protein
MHLNNHPLPASAESPIASTSDDKPPTDDASSIYEYPLAVKMMFNYDAESNATAILHAMLRETVPAWSRDYDVLQVDYWQHFPLNNNIIKLKFALCRFWTTTSLEKSQLLDRTRILSKCIGFSPIEFQTCRARWISTRMLCPPESTRLARAETWASLWLWNGKAMLKFNICRNTKFWSKWIKTKKKKLKTNIKKA